MAAGHFLGLQLPYFLTGMLEWTRAITTGINHHRHKTMKKLELRRQNIDQEGRYLMALVSNLRRIRLRLRLLLLSGNGAVNRKQNRQEYS